MPDPGRQPVDEPQLSDLVSGAVRDLGREIGTLGRLQLALEVAEELLPPHAVPPSLPLARRWRPSYRTALPVDSLLHLTGRE
jgi:hypothetical protein